MDKMLELAEQQSALLEKQKDMINQQNALLNQQNTIIREQSAFLKEHNNQVDLFVAACKVLEKIQNAPNYVSLLEIQDWSRKFLESIIPNKESNYDA